MQNYLIAVQWAPNQRPVQVKGLEKINKTKKNTPFTIFLNFFKAISHIAKNIITAATDAA